MRNLFLLFSQYLNLISPTVTEDPKFPIVVNTWGFTNATIQAWDVINRQKKSAIDAIVAGCSVCEREQCDGTVGYGGSPNENGETCLDAFLMDGKTMNVGAVGSIRNIKDAIAVAKHVLLYTKHSMLVGEQATDFAVQMGFRKETLSTEKSRKIHKDWKAQNCQPNFWQNVLPSPDKHCGPYVPISEDFLTASRDNHESLFSSNNHDTIGMVAIDTAGNIAAGTSTNGANHKIPGRVGDSPIPGSGGYADNTVGAAAATGDGDILMRFLPSMLAVEFMRNGMSPDEAGRKAMERISRHYPKFVGGIVVIDKNGNYGAACHGIDYFPFSIYHPKLDGVKVEKRECTMSM
ncbi:N(4)-(Beta-N-acetylglucosaminyl)-L-asparaginase-like [Chironomus tepperi]|uniref:N(4)-(Beta-N-acetylglucosaminyl)-L-asparaginase- like n=1 Tax=Chironomus tepperi TaxID=113505 RepID=UPI00391F2D37